MIKFILIVAIFKMALIGRLKAKQNDAIFFEHIHFKGNINLLCLSF